MLQFEVIIIVVLLLAICLIPMVRWLDTQPDTLNIDVTVKLCAAYYHYADRLHKQIDDMEKLCAR